MVEPGPRGLGRTLGTPGTIAILLILPIVCGIKEADGYSRVVIAKAGISELRVPTGNSRRPEVLGDPRGLRAWEFSWGPRALDGIQKLRDP